MTGLRSHNQPSQNGNKIYPVSSKSEIRNYKKTLNYANFSIALVQNWVKTKTGYVLTGFSHKEFLIIGQFYFNIKILIKSCF
jgi:hypothetical protein